jgi:CheY-like chemotaxis protein
VVELHDGRVQADSAGPGSGARFTVTLPAAPASEPPRLPSTGGDGLPLPTFAGVNVIVVDDNTDARELLQSIFENAGASVVTASSARDALTACGRRAPDLLLVDLAMPEEDGYHFLRHARELGIRAPAIAVTACAGAAEREQALAGGFDAHLAKPLTVEELLNAASALLVGSRHPEVSPHHAAAPE